MEFNCGFADFDSVFEFYWFVKKHRKYLFKDYQERVQFLFDFDLIIFNIQWSPEKSVKNFSCFTRT